MIVPNTTIIAEAGVNHNGSLDLAHDLIDVAVGSGANIVKFQTFSANSIVSKGAEKAEYQKETTDAGESQYEMIKKLELDKEAHLKLIAYCEKKKIEFLRAKPLSRDVVARQQNIVCEIRQIRMISHGAKDERILQRTSVVLHFEPVLVCDQNMRFPTKHRWANSLWRTEYGVISSCKFLYQGI